MFNFTPTVRNLMLANLLVYLVQVNVRLDPSITQLGSLHPLGSPYFHVWQFFTYMFLHDPSGWGHLVSNMIGLLIFGPLLEQHWGGRRFLAFYLMCGVGAGLLYEGVRAYELHRAEVAYVEYRQNPEAFEYNQFMQRSGREDPDDDAAAAALYRNPKNQELRQALETRAAATYASLYAQPGGGMLGASGAIFGIMFAMLWLFPNTEIYQPPIPIPIKVKYLVLYQLILEIYSGIHQAPGDHVAHFAHLGGALAAFLLLYFWQSGRTRFY